MHGIMGSAGAVNTTVRIQCFVSIACKDDVYSAVRDAEFIRSQLKSPTFPREYMDCVQKTRSLCRVHVACLANNAVNVVEEKILQGVPIPSPALDSLQNYTILYSNFLWPYPVFGRHYYGYFSTLAICRNVRRAPR